MDIHDVVVLAFEFGIRFLIRVVVFNSMMYADRPLEVSAGLCFIFPSIGSCA